MSITVGIVRTQLTQVTHAGYIIGKVPSFKPILTAIFLIVICVVSLVLGVVVLHDGVGMVSFKRGCFWVANIGVDPKFFTTFFYIL